MRKAAKRMSREEQEEVRHARALATMLSPDYVPTLVPKWLIERVAEIETMPLPDWMRQR